tara:strand:- start:80 stop:685 length:606 start_codon:yes stop_codon:yes gene_type:complete
MKILNLKAIPIAHDSNAYYLNKEELHIVRKTKYRTSDEGFYLSETITLLENKVLSSLKKFIIKKAEEYVRDVLEIKDQIYLTQSWCTLNLPNAFHRTHDHPNTFISLVYYAQCKNSNLRFSLNTTSIRECFNFSYTVKKFNIYNSHNWIVPVKTGDIVLFPGHIRHGSLPNKSPEPRLIVGANFFLKGKLGSKKEVSSLTL